MAEICVKTHYGLHDFVTLARFTGSMVAIVYNSTNSLLIDRIQLRFLMLVGSADKA